MGRRVWWAVGVGIALAVVVAIALALGGDSRSAPTATTPIKHLVVIFDENNSFDHYFGTYRSPSNQTIDGLTKQLLTNNPNKDSAGKQVNPDHMDTKNPVPCGQIHRYQPEQKAFHGTAKNHGVSMDGFVVVNEKSCHPPNVMNYYDGSTVTALWNVARHFAMSDNYFASTFGPSTPGALNLVAGTTYGATGSTPGVQFQTPGKPGTMVDDPDPATDKCNKAAGRDPMQGTAKMAGRTIGDVMTEHGMTWGWFQGGFANCYAKHRNLAHKFIYDYDPHHEPFQYFASTRNPRHRRRDPAKIIGSDDRANHQYDLKDFDDAVKAGILPQVSFLKPAAFEDAHAGNSGPLDEQRWIARALDIVEQSKDWDSTAVIITYDDSDGWYDHAYHAPTNSSTTKLDALTGTGECGTGRPLKGQQYRCGPGPRLPLLVVSPWAKVDHVDHTFSTQASIIKFIEDNWNLERLGGGSFDASAGSIGGLFDFDLAHPRAPKLFLDPKNGAQLHAPPRHLKVAPPAGA